MIWLINTSFPEQMYNSNLLSTTSSCLGFIIFYSVHKMYAILISRAQKTSFGLQLHFSFRLTNIWSRTNYFSGSLTGPVRGFVEDLYCAAATHWRMLHCKGPLCKAWNTHVDDLSCYIGMLKPSPHFIFCSYLTIWDHSDLFFTKSALVTYELISKHLSVEC